MVKLNIKTKQKPDKVVEQAVKFFGPLGYGLTVSDQTNTCATFDGDGGSISIVACAEDQETSVDVETQKFDYQAKEFAKQVKETKK
jgi:hypothetical protein